MPMPWSSLAELEEAATPREHLDAEEVCEFLCKMDPALDSESVLRGALAAIVAKRLGGLS